MKKGRVIFATLIICCVTLLLYGMPRASNQEQKKEPEKRSEAKAIDIEAAVTSDHPEFEEGVTCNDCHEMKFDAKTTATHIWLTGESPGRKAGEGIMPKEKVWEEIVRLIGGKKEASKTFVLGTSLNNTPLTTTAEFTLDPKEKVIYGLHEKGTQKLFHIRANPKVSLNWHQEFEGFTDFRCVQIIGRAELLDGSHKDVDRIMIEFLPYEPGARVPKDATPKQRKEQLKKFREAIKPGMVLSKITIEQVTVASVPTFTKAGFRRYQRWTR